jgi:hypothetical protein
MEGLSQDTVSPGQDLNPGPSEHEAGLLTTGLRCSLSFINALFFEKITNKMFQLKVVSTSSPSNQGVTSLVDSFWPQIVGCIH